MISIYRQVLGLGVALLLGAAAAPGARAQGVSNGDGTARLDPTIAADPVVVEDVFPSFVVPYASLYSAGVGLRNRSGGAIEISGMGPEDYVQAGFLYWNVLSYGDPASGEGAGVGSTLTIQRLTPTASRPRVLQGEVVGTGGTPCWGAATINTVYRARVRPNVLSGNGTYLISLDPHSFPLTDGSLPWGSTAPIMINGATLFLIGSGESVVALYDSPLAGTDYIGSPGLNAVIRLPRPSWDGSETRVHIASSDGQSFGPFPQDTEGLSGENTRVNGTAVAGPATTVMGTSDLNGTDGGRLVQLWDTSMHDISDLVPAGNRRFTLGFSTDVPEGTTATDCLVAVAVGVERGGLPANIGQ